MKTTKLFDDPDVAQAAVHLADATIKSKGDDTVVPLARIVASAANDAWRQHQSGSVGDGQ